MAHRLGPNVFSDKEMSVAEAAYVSGILDGEGSIRLRCTKNGRYFTAHLQVVNTNLEMIRSLVETTGNGWVFQRRATGPRQKIVYNWELTANQIRHVLPQLLPYLRAKKRHAEIVLRYFELFNGGRFIPEASIPEMIALCDEIKSLNRRGVWEEEEVSAQEKELIYRCVEPNCGRRRYKSEEYCYSHWLARRDPTIGKCERCGAEMKVVFGTKRFCSLDCQQRAWREDVRKQRRRDAAEGRKPAACPNCGGVVDRTNYAGRVFCNEKCQAQFRNKKQVEANKERLSQPIPCPVCGELFTKRGNRQRYCSDACNKRAYLARKQLE